MLFEQLEYWSERFLRILCPLIHMVIFSENHKRRKLKCLVATAAGFTLGQIYYYYLLKDILPDQIGSVMGLILSSLIAVGNAVSLQIRCICLLILPMFCGKPGRGILKALVLTYVVAGPIANMGLNAKEVVRVFSCSTQLSYNLTKYKYNLLATPFKKVLSTIRKEIEDFKYTLRLIRTVVTPIEIEVENTLEINQRRSDVDLLFGQYTSDKKQKFSRWNNMSGCLKKSICSNSIQPNDDEISKYMKKYKHKMEYRCERQLSNSVTNCLKIFSSSHKICYEHLPIYAGALCWPLMLANVCRIRQHFGGLCNVDKQLDIGFGESYLYLKRESKQFIYQLEHLNLQYTSYEHQMKNVQDARMTAERVVDAFEYKYAIMQLFFLFVNICLALLFVRLVTSAQTYHDLYLTSIDYDNVYINQFFKRIDRKRRKRDHYTLLPLKKMERNRYIDVYSTSYIPSERSKILTQILKVMLEAITATTFVMMDRLFYEALEVVRQYAIMETEQNSGLGDLNIEVEGNGTVASIFRKIIEQLANVRATVPQYNDECVPRPREISFAYYLKIYGGYLCILILLYLNPYTLRLRRLICSYFYPHREKQRILHLYNDILKKRMKIQKTLRRKAVQAVRAHYLSSENFLSLRMKFPQLLGWLYVLPVARMKCLICGDTEPRNRGRHCSETWHSCICINCPFVYCDECWKDIGSSCLACDPVLNELSDVDSMSDDQLPRY